MPTRSQKIAGKEREKQRERERENERGKWDRGREGEWKRVGSRNRKRDEDGSWEGDAKENDDLVREKGIR